MDINQFLNPENEQVHDGLMSIDDAVLSQFSIPEDPDPEEEDITPLPAIQAADALEALYKLQLHEEQQVDGDQHLLRLLRKHERTLLGRQLAKQQQADIRGYFR